MAHSPRLHRSSVSKAAAGAAAVLAIGLAVAQVTAPAELQAAVEKFRHDYKRNDVDSAMELWTASAKEIAPGRVLDLAAIRDSVRNGHRAGVVDFREQDEEYFLGSDMIVKTCRHTTLGESGEVLSDTRYMTLWKKVDGRWRIHREIGIPVER